MTSSVLLQAHPDVGIVDTERSRTADSVASTGCSLPEEVQLPDNAMSEMI